MTVTIDGSLGITTPPVLTVQAGTTTTQPILLTSGTNLTTAVAGSVEYDGKVIYATPQSTQRGITPSPQYFRLNSDLTLANTTSAQAALGVGVTLSASTVYEFEIVLMLSKNGVSTTSHNIAISFGGTATANNISFEITNDYINNVVNTASAFVYQTWFNSLSGGNIYTAALSAATLNYSVVIKGTISVNAGGTFIPQIAQTGLAGGFIIATGSFAKIYPIGASGANTNVGTWA